MLPSTDALSGLLGTLYDAAGEPALWDRFLQQLGRTVRADSAALVMHQVGHEVYTVSRSWDLDPEGARLYQEHYGSVDLWTQRGRASLSAGSVCTSEALCPRDEMALSEMYNDFLVPQHIEHGLFGVLENGASRWATVSVYRSQSLPEFQAPDIELLRFLAPHMQRAFRLHFQFADLEGAKAGFEAALEILPSAIIFLGADQRIVGMNRAAARLTSRNDGLIATHCGLRAQIPSESAKLQRLVAEAVSTSRGRGSSPAGGLRVSRQKGLPLHVLITPVGRLPGSASVPICAIAFISDQSERVRPASEILGSLFGLTPAESRIALLLSDGQAPREIAATLGVSSNTMKSHLSNIYSKTHTSGQVQLVRLLALLLLRMPSG